MTSNQNVSIAIHFNLSILPPKSIIHLRVRINKILKNELILVQIHDTFHNMLVSKKIDPKKQKSLEKDDEGYYLYQISIPMRGKAWKVGMLYTASAKYADTEVSDSMVIGRRKPIVQSDRSVYIIGSSMIVSVISPDLNRDSQKIETIGKKSDHKLTISSKWGKITNYKLKETGPNTGIFQGLVKLVLSHQYNKGKKIKAKASGHGPYNGRLPVNRGDIIKFKFESESGNAELTAYAANFGAAIELDQREYVPTDKVYLTIVAPDFNIHPDKIDKIGNRPDSEIIISSKLGRLRGYELVETGKDTGIFTGEITLKGFKEMGEIISTGSIRLSTSGGRGPKNGKLACSNNDKITVILKTEGMTFQSEAPIKWNIGQINLDSANYSVHSLVTITVTDPDMNLNPNKDDQFLIRVWSDSDAVGITIPVFETGNSSGKFVGVMQLTTSKSHHNRLKVRNGDTITAEYIDRTLPPPYTLTDRIRLTSTSFVGQFVSPLERVVLKDYFVIDENNKIQDKLTIGKSVKICATLTNILRRDQPFALLLQITGEDGLILHLSSISGSLSPLQSLKSMLKWTPQTAGICDVQLFAWQSIDNPNALSPPLQFKIVVNP